MPRIKLMTIHVARPDDPDIAIIKETFRLIEKSDSVQVIVNALIERKISYFMAIQAMSFFGFDSEQAKEYFLSMGYSKNG